MPANADRHQADCDDPSAAYTAAVRRPLISEDNRLWQNALGCLAAAILLPVVILLKLAAMPFERPVERTAREVARYLRDCIEGTGGDWDFDDFVSFPIADPRLDSIRERALHVQEPITEEGLATLKALLKEAEALAEEGPSRPN